MNKYSHNYLDPWYQSLLSLLVSEDQSSSKSDRTGTGTKSLFGVQFRHNMKEGFPLLTTKKMAFKTMVTELLWFLRGDTNIKFLVDNGCHIWDGDAYKNYVNKTNEDIFKSDITLPVSYYPIDKDKFIDKIKTDDDFAKQWGELGPIYGKQWRDWSGKNDVILTEERDEFGYLKFISVHTPGIDQISKLINELKTNPDSRRLMVNAWNVDELNQMTLPPCHYGFQMYTRELSFNERIKLIVNSLKSNAPLLMEEDEKTIQWLNNNNVPTRAISLMWNQRSVDTFLGLPFNIASYGLLLEIIAKTVNMIPDQLIGNLGDVHLYNNHLEQAKEQISRTPYELPKLNINTEFWPTESGSCGEGPLDATAVFNSFQNINFCKCLLEEDIQLYDYQSHPAIKAPLSN